MFGWPNDSKDIVWIAKLPQKTEGKGIEREHDGKKYHRPDVRQRGDATGHATGEAADECRRDVEQDEKKNEENEDAEIRHDERPNGAKSLHCSATLTIHHRDHEMGHQGYDEREENESDRKENEERESDDGRSGVRGDEEKEREPSDEEEAAKREDELENEKAVRVRRVFPPRLHDGAAIPHDAIDEDKTAVGIQPD